MKRDLLLIVMALMLWGAGSALIAKAQGESIMVRDVYQLPQMQDAGQSGVWRELRLPDRRVQVQLAPGGLINRKWILSDTQALYWTEKGQLFVYGHNTNRVFGPLKSVQAGEKVELTDERGGSVTYKVYDRKTTSPWQTGVLYEDKAGVVLITCDGLWDQTRLILKANKEE